MAADFFKMAAMWLGLQLDQLAKPAFRFRYAKTPFG